MLERNQEAFRQSHHSMNLSEKFCVYNFLVYNFLECILTLMRHPYSFFFSFCFAIFMILVHQNLSQYRHDDHAQLSQKFND
mmetsp:Transcript_32845/g.38104  ORF Transcript_32845/g.38104 Transcript_32845/m.38104 type:complete len:81 (-) Transcript_32845:219-461(-)